MGKGGGCPTGKHTDTHGDEHAKPSLDSGKRPWRVPFWCQVEDTVNNDEMSWEEMGRRHEVSKVLLKRSALKRR